MLAGICGYPDSSITLVSRKRSKDIEGRLQTLIGALENNDSYESMKRHVASAYRNWASERELTPRTDDPDYNLWLLISNEETETDYHNVKLPFDFRKLAFMCRLALHLAGSRHEGHPLRFAFLLGFTHDQTVSQLEGAVEQFGTDLQWPDNDLSRNDSGLVAKWIEANALILQRWDLALFFESFEEKQDFAIGKRLLRIKKLEYGDPPLRNPKWSGYPTNEFELRKSFVQMTHDQPGSAALVISDRGATLILRGRSYLFRFEGERGKEKLIPLLQGKKSFVEKFENSLTAELKKLAGNTSHEWELRSRQLRALTEALVTMGHGALIAIRISKNIEPLLPPLAPVWRLRESQTVSDLSDDIMTFALAAALDGATEIIFRPEDKSEGEVVFRRYANHPFTPWKQQEGKVTRDAKFRPSKISWGDMMTFGTRHRSALALSRRKQVLVLTVSADGPVRIWRDGDIVDDIKFKP